jgi:MFS family permease
VLLILVSHYTRERYADLVEIRPEDAMTLKKSIYAFTVLYNPALMATKTAILLLYIRMAAAHPFLRYASYATLGVVNTAGIVLTFLNIFQCRPVRAAFDRDTGTCIDVVSLYLSSAPINVLTDLAILLLPLPILTRLRLEFRQKVALVATFTVGAFVTVVDVIRIAYLQDALKEEVLASTGDGGINSIGADNTAIATKSKDFTYHASFSLMWSAVEVSVGLMCCCVLVLKPLIMKVVPILLHSHRNSISHITGSRGNVTGDGNVSRGRLRSLSMIGGGETRSQMSMAQITPEMASKDQMSPNPNMGTILESPPVPGIGDEDEDDGMDFFQMLAADPQTSAAPRHVTLPNTVAPLAFPTELISPTTEVPPAPPMDNKATMSNLSRKFTRHATLISTRTRKESVDPTQEPTQNFFDFVNMNGTKPLTELSAREAWWPILFGKSCLILIQMMADCEVSILFFLWGFAYGLLGTLNSEIISLLSISPARSIALHNAYWLGYLIGPPAIGHWVLTRAGFKAAFMTGLAIYACGAMAFWPSSVLRSYAGFFISNFMIACGLSVLEIAANPFIAIAGPGRLSEARLCFAQGIQAIGGFSSPILAQKALFQRVEGIDLFRVQWCYLAVALFVTFLAVVFFYVPLSEASDADLETVALQRMDLAGLDHDDRIFRKFKLGHFALATGALRNQSRTSGTRVCKLSNREPIHFGTVPFRMDYSLLVDSYFHPLPTSVSHLVYYSPSRYRGHS